jgi:tetratricopeptide (TPR) repeat protein
MTNKSVLNQSGTSEARQETVTSSPDNTVVEAETLADTRVGADIEEKAEEKTDIVNPPSDTAASLQSEAAVAPAVRIVCFGTVDILLNGTPLSPLDSRFRASREFELLAFLAQSAALRRQAFVDRSTITEALLTEGLDEDDDEIDSDGEDYRRSPLGGWKYRLCRRLRRYGVPDHAWLESRADGALRLRTDVQIDLVDFLQVSSQLRKARDLIRRSASQQIEREMVFEWLQQLQRVYRDRGEFAEQFKFQEWTQEPRRRYRNIYWHALFYAAEFQASLGERQMAIQLAEELLDQEEVETEVVYESLLTWLHEDGNKSDLPRWLNKYRNWYAATHDGRSLDRAHPDLIDRLTRETSPAAPAKKPSA